MSTPAFKILHGTVIIGDAKGPLELKVLLDRHIKEMNLLASIVTVAINSDDFQKAMTEALPRLQLLSKLTIPTESFELFRQWSNLHMDSQFALVYSVEDPSDCFVISGEAAVSCGEEEGDPRTYEELKEFYTGPGAGTQSQSVN